MVQELPENSTKEESDSVQILSPTNLAEQESKDKEQADELGRKMDHCVDMIKELEKEIITLSASQEYYRKKLRKLGRRQQILLNMRLL